MGSCMGGYGLAPLHPPEQSSQVFIQLEQSSNFSKCSFGHVQSTNIWRQARNQKYLNRAQRS